jgi:predicted MFS family arabinose efflux permease
MANVVGAANLAQQPVSSAFSRTYRGWLLAMLLIMNVLNLADRQGIAAVAQAIKLDLKLSDSQMGLVMGLGFAVFYCLLALPLTRLAERTNRTRLIATAVAVFGVMGILCSRANSFWQLLLCRIGVGMGDAGLGPPVGSLLGDHYPAHRRASAMSIIWLGAPIGVVFGSSLGGWLAENVGWRWTFIDIGVAGLIVSGVALLTLREPPRGMYDPPGSAQEAPPPMWTVLRFLLSKPSVRHILLGCGLAAVSMNGIGQFLGQFLIRNYHLGYSQMGRVLALIAGIAMASGLALGGFGVDWAGRFDKRWYTWGPALGLMLATPAFLLGFNQATIPATIAVLMAAHIALFVYWTPTLATAQNMVGPSMRASSYFVVWLMLSLVGIGLGPTLSGFVSDAFARGVFTLGNYASSCPGGRAVAGATQELIQSCAQASAIGLRRALTTMSLTFVWASLHYFLAARTLREDLENRYEANLAEARAAHN